MLYPYGKSQHITLALHHKTITELHVLHFTLTTHYLSLHSLHTTLPYFTKQYRYGTLHDSTVPQQYSTLPSVPNYTFTGHHMTKLYLTIQHLAFHTKSYCYPIAPRIV